MSFNNVKIIGHRGAGTTGGKTGGGDIPVRSEIPEENTIESFKYALDNGADGIEFDICLSSDGVPFVIHPSTPRLRRQGSFNYELG